LIGFDTVSHRPNMALIDYVRGVLDAAGIASVLLPDPAGGKANLYATVGPADIGGVMLSGHTDVVPVEGQAWTRPPFALTEAEGRLYGRGTADMKSFLAIALALVPEMAALTRPIHLALSYDEEVGCLGAPTLIASLLNTVPRPAAVIVGEPTGMRVVTAHKSIFLFATHVRGFEVHSSLQDDGVSAIMFAGRMLAWLGERQRQNRLRALPSAAFAPGYTTVHCGRIEGGTASNITARDCYFLTDIRALPTERAEDHFRAFERFCREELEPEMQAVEPSCHIRFDVLADVPGFAAGVTEPAVLLAQQLTGQNGTEAVSYAAEAGQFSAAGLSVVVCGPGEIAQAHQPDEYITTAQFAAGIEFQRRLIDQLSR